MPKQSVLSGRHSHTIHQTQMTRKVLALCDPKRTPAAKTTEEAGRSSSVTHAITMVTNRWEIHNARREGLGVSASSGRNGKGTQGATVSRDMRYISNTAVPLYPITRKPISDAFQTLCRNSEFSGQGETWVTSTSCSNRF